MDSEDNPSEALPEAPVAPDRKPLRGTSCAGASCTIFREAEKHCSCCGRDLRPIAEETSERYEYIPASLKVIEDVQRRYAYECTVKAEKPAQPTGKSAARASLLMHVIVAKWADHQPPHRQELSRKTMDGWAARCADLLEALYSAAKKELIRIARGGN